MRKLFKILFAIVLLIAFIAIFIYVAWLFPTEGDALFCLLLAEIILYYLILRKLN